MEREYWDAPASGAGQSLAPAPAPRRSRGRALFARFLFATLFLGVATLLGYAVKKKLDAGSLQTAAPEVLVRVTR